ncbi:taste receptor type 1 member 3 [Synchiropus splendidus]|uniref:taste receptor type 1 member 3 n=1 Tax=Synchiropus splendidus TaxID=270530 RepID=UPI00237E2598|nr:taste receptor type 1 member 3 [Synchiropus splendidus]
MAGLLGLLVFWVSLAGSMPNRPDWFHNISTNFFYLSGDVMLGGLFPIHERSDTLMDRTVPNNITCERLNALGLGLSLVMKYAVDEINGKQRLLPGMTLGYDIYDTCKESAVIMRPTLSFLTAKSTRELDVRCNYTDHETRVSAVIGPLTSEMVSVIGKLLGFFLIPQISYGATSDKFSDNVLYPSFFRTVPTDKWQVQAMAHVLTELHWNWVAVVGSDEEYGQQGVEEFSKEAEKMSVCVAYQGLIPVYTDPEPVVKNIIDNIEAAKVGVVVVISLVGPAELFFQQVINRNITMVWIASTSWAVRHEIKSLPNVQKVGTIIGFTYKILELPQLYDYTLELFTKLSEQPTSFSFDRPVNTCPQCVDITPANISLITDAAVQGLAFSVYAAVNSVAQALHDMLGCNSQGCQFWEAGTKILPWQLLEVLRNTSIDINGTRIMFDANGNPNIGYNVVQWVWNGTDLDFQHVGIYNGSLSIDPSLFKWHTNNSEMPKSTCSAACGVGQVRRVKGFHSCCFDCIDCLEGTFQKEKEDIQCTKCPEGQWSYFRSTNCTLPTFTVLSWDSPEAVALILGMVVLLLCQASVLLLFLKHRGTHMVMASGGNLSFVILLSLMGACLSLLLFLGEPGDTVCRLQLPLCSVFQTVAVSIITSVALQIFFVTEFNEKVGKLLPKLRLPVNCVMVLICLAVQAGLCGWFVQDGPTLSEYKDNMKIDFLETFLSCPLEPMLGFVLMQGFPCALTLTSFMCTFIAVKPLHQYNLARDITFSCLVYCVLWVVFIPIYIGLNHRKRSVAHVAFSLSSNFALIVAYFVPKCFLLLRKPELNTPEYFCTFLEGAPMSPPEEEAQAPPQAPPAD